MALHRRMGIFLGLCFSIGFTWGSFKSSDKSVSVLSVASYKNTIPPAVWGLFQKKYNIKIETHNYSSIEELQKLLQYSVDVVIYPSTFANHIKQKNILIDMDILKLRNYEYIHNDFLRFSVETTRTHIPLLWKMDASREPASTSDNFKLTLFNTGIINKTQKVNPSYSLIDFLLSSDVERNLVKSGAFSSTHRGLELSDLPSDKKASHLRTYPIDKIKMEM